MNSNDKETPSGNDLSDDEEPILLTEEAEPATEEDEEVIDLVDVVDDGSKKDDSTQKESIEIAPGCTISPEKFDQALERTVEKLYGDKIESMLVEVVRKKVSAEIEKIKQSFGDD